VLLLATVMVKFEGMVLLGLWGVLLLLDKHGRAALWPLRKVGLPGLLVVAACIPYGLLRLHGTVSHPDSAGMKLLAENWRATLSFVPTVWATVLSRQFLNNDFAAWTSPDNQNAFWVGKWLGLRSFADEATLGVGWLCLVVLVISCFRHYHRFRPAMLYLFIVFMAFLSLIAVVCMAFATEQAAAWNSLHPDLPPRLVDYTTVLASTAGRYLYPVLMAWFTAGVVLLARAGVHPVALREATPASDEP
jgi:hypothetical protein